MNSFKTAGETMLLSHEGTQQLASALVDGISAIARMTARNVSATLGRISTSRSAS